MTPEDMQFMFCSQADIAQGSLAHDTFFQGKSYPFQDQGDSQQDIAGRKGPRGGKKPLRAWQQQLYALEAEVAQKERDLQRAAEEGERLRQRMKVLEAVLPIREQLSQLLRQQHWPCMGRRSAPVVQVMEEGEVSTSSDSNISMTAQHRSAAQCRHAASAGPHTALIITHKSGPSGRPPCEALMLLPQSYTTAPEVAAAATLGQMPFSPIPPQNTPPPHTVREVAVFWNNWVREAGLVLHALDARPHEPGPQLQMVELREQLGVVFGPLRMKYPLLLTELVAVNVKTGQRDESPPETFWIPVVQGMRLTDDQVAGCRAALTMYHERMGKILDERRSLTHQLQLALGAVPKAPRSHLHQNGAGTAGHVVEDLTAELCQNVAREGHAFEFIKDFMGSNLFSLVQMTRAIVLSYPYFPDGLAVLSTVVAMSSGSTKCPQINGAT